MSNKIKWIIPLLLVAVLTACGGGGGGAEDDGVFRVAVIMPSAINDLAFSQSMYDALITLQEEMGGEEAMELVYSDNMFVVDDAAAAIRDYASQGYDLIIAHGSQYGSSLREIAPDFPETSFAHGTTVDTFVVTFVTFRMTFVTRVHTIVPSVAINSPQPEKEAPIAVVPLETVLVGKA